MCAESCFVGGQVAGECLMRGRAPARIANRDKLMSDTGCGTSRQTTILPPCSSFSEAGRHVAGIYTHCRASPFCKKIL